MSPAKRRRPLRVATDRGPAEQLAALRHPPSRALAGLADLLGVFVGARGRITRTAVGTLHPSHDALIVDTLLVLAAGAAVIEHLQTDRWPSVHAALTVGTTLPQVAEALGLDDIEVIYGLRSWADGQLNRAAMTADEHAAALALVDIGGPW